MKSKFYFLLCFANLFIFPLAFAGNGGKEVTLSNKLKTWPKTLMVRVKPEYRAWLSSKSFSHSKAQSLFSEINLAQFFARFPYREVPKAKFHFTGEVIPDMTLIFQLSYQADIPESEAARVAMNSGLFEYAEPKYIRQTCLIPNDPRRNQQYYLDSIQAYQAWDITQGDTNVVVGICDSGVQTDHEDLVSQIKVDPSEPINGIDDNNDGKIDNNMGWDFCGPTFIANYPGDNDPNITQGGASHGTHVAGISAAKANNGKGISGVAFHCKILPLKCAPDNGGGSIYFGYEAIEYGASHGADVINCSWGSEGGFSVFEQEVITDATLTFNCLIVAAAGNDNSPNLFYPAYYEHVLAVCALGANNRRADFTNYNYKVRVGAPGVGIMSTYFNNAYQNSSGTSMASPVVAGVAALVKSQFPALSPDQIAQRIRVTADNVYGVTGNNQTSLFGKLGKGIVNAYRAVLEQTPGIKNIKVNVTDNNNDIFQPGDTLYISGSFINYLQTSSPNLKVRFSLVVGGSSSFVTQIASTQEYFLGEMTTNQLKESTDKPYKIFLRLNLPTDRNLDIRMTYTDGSYSDFDHTSILLNPTYINVEKNNISTTVTSKGRIGFNDDGSTDGLGFKHKNRQTLYELGLMTGTSATKIASTVRNTTSGAAAVHDNDYRNLSFVKEVGGPPNVFQYNNTMSDFMAGAAASNIDIWQRSYALTSLGDSNYVIFRYSVRNKNATPLTNFYIGYFGDFDISANGQQDKAGWSEAHQMGYAYNTNNDGLYAGIAILGGATPNYYAIDNDGTAVDSFGVYDGFSDQEKFTGLSSGLYRKNAGITAPKDVSMVIGSGPYTIAPGDTLHVGFAVVAGENLSQIQLAAVDAIDLWPIITANEELVTKVEQSIRLFPNPANSEIYLSNMPLGEKFEVFNSLGQTVEVRRETLDGDLQKIDISGLSRGIYLVKPKKGKILRFVKE